MPAAKTSVKTTVLDNTKIQKDVFAGNFMEIQLDKDDYDRLTRALDRENNLRKLAYDFINKDGDGPPENWVRQFEIVLNGTLDVTKETITSEVSRMLNAGLSKEYIVDRTKKLLTKAGL